MMVGGMNFNYVADLATFAVISSCTYLLQRSVSEFQ
jgi:hypothetical protein